MKVCMVAYAFYDEDNRIRRYAEALAKRGEQVEVIALRKEGQPAQSVLKGVRVHRIQDRIVNERGKFTYLGRLLRFLWRSTIFLTREHFRQPYDLIHVHSVPDFEVFSTFVPKLTGCKVILDIHDLMPEFYASKFQISQDTFVFKSLAIVEKLSAAFADHVIAPNHIWQKRLESRSVPAGKCTTVLNFPDPDIFQKRGRNRNDGKVIFLYPGTLNFHQGLDIAIRAFSLIEGQAPQAEFHIYGEGEQRTALEKLIVELGLERKVFLRNRMPLDDISRIIENADIGVVPKRNSGFGNEAFSTKIFEFMMLGIPVIAPKTAVDRYYFNDAIVQFFEPEDEKSLAAAMLLLIQDRTRSTSLAQNASHFVRQYTWDANKQTYLALVDSLVAGDVSSDEALA